MDNRSQACLEVNIGDILQDVVYDDYLLVTDIDSDEGIVKYIELNTGLHDYEWVRFIKSDQYRHIA
jgi:hypothetical protein